MELPVTAEDALEEMRTGNVQIARENVEMNHNNNESVEDDFIFNENGVEESVVDACRDYDSNESVIDEKKRYENYDAVSLDSKSAFAPTCNFIFNENGVEESVLDACLDYNSNESGADEEKKYQNYDTASLDSKSAFAPSCNFIFNENGVEESVLDACLYYTSSESVVDEKKKYENYDAVSLDSKSAFAPSCNFIFNENGVEESVLDACLDYNNNESGADEEKKYENYDAVSLDSKSAFAPSCNFIFSENGVEDSVLDACLDYNSSESVVEEKKKYENYDAVSLESNCVFAPSYDFLLDEHGVEDSVLDACLDVIKEDKPEELSIDDVDRSVDSDNNDDDDKVDEEERIRKLRAEIREMNGETDDDWKYLTDEDDDEEEIAAKVAAMDFGDIDFTRIAKIKRRNKPWNRVKSFFMEKLDDLKFGCDVMKYHVKRTATAFLYKHLHWRMYRYGRYHWV